MGISFLILIFVSTLPVVFPTTTTTLPVPPAQAVPEGNFFTTVTLVGSGLYLLWLRGRKVK
jgi:hypothetical protein